ncbi:MAG: DUF1501 domain-containing protein [Bryobacteraceae bacterium]
MMNHENARRRFLKYATFGLGPLGLAVVAAQSGFASSAPKNPLAPKAPPLPARAKRLVHIFANGGISHIDTFDPKPALKKYAGQNLPIHLRTERKTGAAMPSPFEFRKHGESGIEISEIFPELASCADDLCIIRSMHTNIPNHEPSMLMMNCGSDQQVRPSMGSWVTYGLGSENQNLPGFLVLCPGGLPTRGAANWRSAFLPGAYQGTHIDTQETEIERLVENVRSRSTGREAQRRQLDTLARFNQFFSEKHGDDPVLEARVQSFELAFRMQMEAEDAFDIGREPQSIRDLYGDTVHGRQMLIARRLLEKGVRVVQVWHGAGQPWDSHSDLEKNHRNLASQCDRPIAAFLKDLKQRGLLDDTVVVFGGEFGRTPVVELPAFGSNLGGDLGRDHNSYGFSVWLAGGGVKGGHIHGATDEFGFRAQENRVHVHDLHATLLWLLGFDHEKLTYRYAGRDFRLTDVEGHVVRDILA